MINPGSTIGILGGGQLGRMLAHAAHAMGYQVGVWEPAAAHCCHGVVDWVFSKPYMEEGAAEEFASRCDVVTLEFENVPATVAEAIARKVPVRPGPLVLSTAQNRVREKTFLREHKFPHAPFVVIEDSSQLEEAVQALGGEVVLKTSESGYDGKGQWKIKGLEQLEEVRDTLTGYPLVAEKWIEFKGEWSVLVARSPSGQTLAYPAIWNEHRNHILDTSWVWETSPEENTRRELEKIAVRLAQVMKLEGLMAVEFFWGTSGQIMINEIAPRPHNSGHYSIDGTPTSQFEQVIRAICDLPLGDVKNLGSTAMVNLLGDLWANGEPNWKEVMKVPGVHLHLYGKKEARAGRKMGHLNLVADDARHIRSNVNKVRKILGMPAGSRQVFPF